MIKKYDLSDIKTRGYDFYNCSSSNGLAEYNRDKYLKLRADFNCAENHDEDYYIMLYVLIVYAFNNQIRFNRKGEFNLPPGKRDFNQKMQKKLKTFIGLIHEQNVEFTSLDFRELDVDRLNKNDFVYAGPPYLITCASYNEQDGWKRNDEIDLLQVLDELTSQGIRFALSNVLEAKGLENKILKNWIESRPAYKMIDLNYSYTNSNYQRQNKEQKTREVLVVNY